jgi:phosphoribosyl 1,2-cyclic phosphate phosphodiesterase
LGSGTSQGVPIIACNCEACLSANPKDKRLRSSALLELENETLLIDAGPDFRTQLLRQGVQKLDAILLTHEHKDHIAGLDDVRAFNYKQKKPMPIYCQPGVENALKKEFHYAFEARPYPGAPQFEIHHLTKSAFQINQTTIQPIEVFHHQLSVLGFRIGKIAYITDAKTVLPEECEKLHDLDILIINCLHEHPHRSHFNLEEALAFHQRIQPKHTYLTHISHLFGKHQAINERLPNDVSLCFDGLQLDFSY